jgi:hypothetical protein
MRAIRGPALLLAALAASGCFDDPVQQRLELRFRPDGAVEVEARATIRAIDSLMDEEPIRRRVEEQREVLAEDGFGWSGRLAGIEPEKRRLSQDFTGRELRERRFEALVADPARLERLLPDGLVRPLFRRHAGSRASRWQRELIAEREERIASAYLDYIEAAEKLIVLLDDRPGRRQALLWALLEGDDSLQGPPPGDLELTEDEQPVVERVSRAMQAVLSAFTDVPEGERRTINEISRLVHDPFEFELVVQLPVRAMEHEGFVVDGDRRRLTVPRRSLAEALEQLSSRWLEPDWLMLLWAGPWRDDSARLDLAALAALPRRAEPPFSTAELRSELAAALRPPDLLRVRWSAPPPPDPGELDWWPAAQR